MVTDSPTLSPAADPTRVDVSAPGRHPDRSVRQTSLRRQKRVGNALMLAFLVIAALIMATPFLWMALSAMRDPSEMAKVPMPLIPQDWRLENFAETLERAPFGIYARNSFILASAAAILNVVFASACGYSLAKLRFAASKFVFAWTVACIMIPFYATVIPVFLMVRHMPLFGGNSILGQGGIGWIDSWWALIVPGAVSPFMVFLFRQFYVGTPTELIEAARLDGVSEFGIYSRIITPLIKPGLLTVALLSFEAGWNNFLWPLLVTTSENLRVIQVGIASFRQEATTDWHLLMAGTTMAAVPMIVLFLVFQRYFVQGFAASGIK
ncbi:carbohydrate ABC transporter permease [Brachybacterium saurashtrense]|uniref:Carbohydrate ABC transporter permease n=1 Tax=Brachybacterium saurashtrense TaxID=556288 RepID=A0A345YTM3_9MICO|nr:carbohydrate ABC transporter permease [Brachybacterium saurashtrense]AXK47275.1 carbohydrate ABC transporter permease [Brachybacterium saurashtrense]RRR24396.1 carbohydrate ABC transporter permease [Brachybacterium saurashtrense]